MERKGAGIERVFVKGLVAIGLVAAGAGGAMLVHRYPGAAHPAEAAAQAEAGSPAAGVPAAATPGTAAAPGIAAEAPPAEVEVLLPPEMVTQAGIKTAPATALDVTAAVQVPGIVTANGYREVRVTPLVGGIVTRVHVELGTAVKRGAPVVTLFSADLAEAQTKYLSMTAMAEAERRKLERTKELADIGAASRQELEEATAAYASRATEVEGARQRLLLLGLTREHVQRVTSPDQVVSDVIVPAPIDGVVTSRSANLGMVVGPGQELLVVTDLSDVWVVGDLYEQDFRAVRVGSTASLTTSAYPDLALRGRVSYIDPRVDPQTRTVKVRVEVPNAGGRLRLGMYMTMSFTVKGGERVAAVPRAAVQAIGDRQVVYVRVEGEEGRFIQREIRIGRLVGDVYTVLGGLEPGEVVVTEGSFYLRAESVRNTPS
jgi:RND family efflux transporter MFP subunit